MNTNSYANEFGGVTSTAAGNATYDSLGAFKSQKRNLISVPPANKKPERSMHPEYIAHTL